MVSAAPPTRRDDSARAARTLRGIALLLAIGVALLASSSIASAAAPSEPYFTRIAGEPIFERDSAAATPLPDGSVLIEGGDETLTLRQAEIFDPATGTFSEVPGLTRLVRRQPMAAALADGRVLIVGGFNNISYNVGEIFDPMTGTFSEVPGEMTIPRIGGFAATLPDGNVLIGDGDAAGEGREQREPTAELFHPASGTFTALAARPLRWRGEPAAATLPDGRVLIVGGRGNRERGAEIFDPVTDSFSELAQATELPRESVGPESQAASALLPDGKMFISGGIRRGGFESSEAVVFDPAGPSLQELTAEQTTERAGAAAALLPGGKVLIVGGGWPEAGHTAELFVPAAEIGYSGADLGAQLVGQSTGRRSVLVTNVGAQPLQIDSVALAGDPAFAIEADACGGHSLAFGASCAIGVDFTPKTVGSAAAALEFVDNEATPKTVPLTASGYLPTETSSPGMASPAPVAVAPPAPKVPDHAAPAKPRHSRSVGCAAKRLHSGRVQVTCRVHLAAGAWEARLLHASKVVSDRRVGSGTRRLVFTRGAPARGKAAGAYRLLVVPVD